MSFNYEVLHADTQENQVAERSSGKWRKQYYPLWYRFFWFYANQKKCRLDKSYLFNLQENAQKESNAYALLTAQGVVLPAPETWFT